MPDLYPFLPSGNAEAAVIDILKNHTPELIPYAPTISATMVGYDDPSLNWIEVTQYGGSMRHLGKVDKPRIDIACLSPDIDEARAMCAIAQASLVRIMGNYSGHGLILTDVKLETGINRVPDKNQETSRYIVALRLTCTPSGEIS